MPPDFRWHFLMTILWPFDGYRYTVLRKNPHQPSPFGVVDVVFHGLILQYARFSAYILKSD